MLETDHYAPLLILKKAIEANTISELNHIPLGCATMFLHVVAHVQQLQIASSNEEFILQMGSR